MPSGLISISSGCMGASRALAASGENASVERPWKERVQSTWRSPSSRTTFWSFRPPVKSGTSAAIVSGDSGGWGSRDVVLEAGDAACCCCAWYTLVDVKARRASACLEGLRVLFNLLEGSGVEELCRGSEKS